MQTWHWIQVSPSILIQNILRNKSDRKNHHRYFSRLTRVFFIDTFLSFSFSIPTWLLNFFLFSFVVLLQHSSRDFIFLLLALALFLGLAFGYGRTTFEKVSFSLLLGPGFRFRLAGGAKRSGIKSNVGLQYLVSDSGPSITNDSENSCSLKMLELFAKMPVFREQLKIPILDRADGNESPTFFLVYHIE